METNLILAFALSLDAFSVAMSCGMKIRTSTIRRLLKISFFFGFFQFLMPLLGGYFALLLEHYIGFIKEYSPWLMFTVFFGLGLKSLWTCLIYKKKEASACLQCHCQSWSCLISLSIATSIDAFLAGLAIVLSGNSIYSAAIIIGIFTFLASMVGGLLGNKVAHHFERLASLLSGLILIGLAIKAVL
jgi:putative Mn2+ efflux pump MntP